MGGLARLFTTQERYWEVANLAAEILAQVEAAGDYYGCYRDKLIGLDHSIRAQYHLRDFVSVEKNLLEAIDVITNACGETDPAAIDYWSQLEGYLRGRLLFSTVLCHIVRSTTTDVYNQNSHLSTDDSN